MFTNVLYARIITTSYEGDKYWTISLIALLSIIAEFSETNNNFGYIHKKQSQSWLSLLWKSASDTIRKQYNEAGYDIDLKQSLTKIHGIMAKMKL